MKMEVKCTFEDLDWSVFNYNYYTCSIEEEKLKSNQEIKLNGNHEEGKTNLDVEGILIMKMKRFLISIVNILFCFSFVFREL